MLRWLLHQAGRYWSNAIISSTVMAFGPNIHGLRFAYRNVHYGISSCWNKQLYSWLHASGTYRHTQLDCVSRSLMGWSGPVLCESLVFSVITLDCAQTATIWLITLSCGGGDMYYVRFSCPQMYLNVGRWYLNALSFLGCASVVLCVNNLAVQSGIN